MAPQLLQLGKNGLKVSQLGYGLMGLSQGTHGQGLTDEEAFALLDQAIELGETFWDTAE
jgi:aryl-alcohol dehydrogenase-like predicted oxidoreductase